MLPFFHCINIWRSVFWMHSLIILIYFRRFNLVVNQMERWREKKIINWVLKNMDEQAYIYIVVVNSEVMYMTSSCICLQMMRYIAQLVQRLTWEIVKRCRDVFCWITIGGVADNQAGFPHSSVPEKHALQQAPLAVRRPEGSGFVWRHRRRHQVTVIHYALQVDHTLLMEWLRKKT